MILKSKSGFFLLEILLTIALISVSLVVIIQSLLTVHQGSHQGMRLAIAALIAEHQINELMLNKVESKEETGKMKAPLDAYVYHVTSQVPEEINSLSIKEVSLTISWPSMNKNRSLMLDAYVYQPDAQ